MWNKKLLGDIDFLKKPILPKLFLTKPNRFVVDKISDAYDIQLDRNINSVDTLKFKVPYYRSENNQLIYNRYVDELRELYHVKVNFGSFNFWFIISKIIESSNDSEDYKEIECNALPYELSYRNIKSYLAESKGAIYVLEEILADTRWALDNVDPDFELSKRTFEFQDNTLLDCIYQVAETYNAVVEFDSENRSISLIKAQFHGQYRGANFSGGNLLKGFDKESDTDEQITRIRPEGKDGMTINAVNPTGQSYIADYSYFMYPFQRDEDKNVIQSSYYMSDELCHAILDYSEKIESVQDQFEDLTTQKNSVTNSLSVKTAELTDLKTELKVIEQIEDNQLTNNNKPVMFIESFTYNGSTVAKSFNALDRAYNYAVLCRVVNNTNITVKLSGVTKSVVSNAWTVLGKLYDVTSTSVEFSGTGTSEVYIQIANISSTEYDTSGNELTIIEKYCANNKRMQIVEKEVEISNVRSQLTAINNLIRGLQVLLSEENNFEPELLDELEDYIRYRDFKDDKYVYETDLYQAGKDELDRVRTPQLSMSVSIVNYLENIEQQGKWHTLRLGDESRTRYERANIDVKAKIIGISYDFENSDIKLTIANVTRIDDDARKAEEYLKKTNYNSTTLSANKEKWTRSITDVSDMSRLFDMFYDKVAEQINMSVNNTVVIDNRGITIYDPSDLDRLIRLTSGSIGLSNNGGDSYNTALTPDGVIAPMVLGKLLLGSRITIGTEDGIWLTEGAATTITDRCNREAMKLGLYEENPDKFGMVINRYDSSEPCSTSLINRIVADSEDGFKIQRWNGTQFVDVFYVDNNGLLYAIDMTAKRLKITSDNDELLLDSESKYMDIGRFDNIITNGKLTALEKLQVLGERTRIMSEYSKLLAQANIYKETTRDSSIRISTTAFTTAYNNLMSYLSPLLIDMDATSEIDRDEFILKFKNYYDETTNIINAINDSIKYSSVQFGSMFNQVLIDYATGITATRSDNMYRSIMNGTRGFIVQRNTGTSSVPVWKDVFYADINGKLYAQDIEIVNSFMTNGGIEGAYIILRDGDGGVIKLFPEDGLWAGAEDPEDAGAWITPDGKLKLKGKNGEFFVDTDAGVLNLNNIDVQGAGRITGDSIIVNVAVAGVGIISDLTVRRLVTHPKVTTLGTSSDYIQIEDQKIMLKTGVITNRSQLVSNGKPLYWTDSSETLATTEVTSYPIWDLIINDIDKMVIDFDTDDPNKSPRMTIGTGSGYTGTSGKAFMRKPSDSYVHEYYTSDNDNPRRLTMDNEGVKILSQQGVIKIEHHTGTYFEISSNGNNIKMFHKTAGEIALTTSGMTANINGNISLNATGTINFSGTGYNYA